MTSPLDSRLASRGAQQSTQRASYDELSVALAEASAHNRRLVGIVRSVATQVDVGNISGVEGPLLSAIKDALK